MSVPKRSSDKDPNFKVEETLVTESVFTEKNLENTVAFLKTSKCTGKLTVDMNQGGITRITFLQSQAVDVDYS